MRKAMYICSDICNVFRKDVCGGRGGLFGVHRRSFGNLFIIHKDINRWYEGVRKFRGAGQTKMMKIYVCLNSGGG